MANQEILTKAIQKAIDGGWKNEEMYSFDSRVGSGLFNPGIGEYGGHEHESVLIFNHDFAKALWGEPTDTMTVQNNNLNVKQLVDMNGWQYHLQQMVIADDPIKYLGENI